MNQNPSNDTPKQLGFSDIQNQDPRPLPLIAAERWNFPLQYHASDGKTFFAIQDWIVGLVGVSTQNAADTWRKMKKSEADFKSVSVQSLQYHASDGKKYQRDFADDKTLYLISQYLRATGNRPMLDEIRQFLAVSGATMDDWRLHPDKMLSIAQSRMLSDIERHEKAGLGNRPEIELLRAKMDATKTLKELKHSVSRLLEMTGQEWAKFHNEELWQLLGYTAAQIKAARDPKKSARDNLNVFEINGLKYAENQLIALLSMQKTIDPERLRNSVQFIFKPIGENLRGMLESIGIDILSGKYQLPSGK